MYVGHSSSRGILIGDTARPAPNAVYGYYQETAAAEEEKIVLETGEFKALLTRQDAHEKTDLREEGGAISAVVRVFGVMGLMLALCVIIWILFGVRNFLAALTFSVLAYFPLMVILYARQNHYRCETLFQQFRRHHGCEHAMVKLLSKNRNVHSGMPDDAEKTGDYASDWLTLQNLKTSPIYDAECGTVHAGYFLTLAAEIGLLLSDLVNLGVLRSLAVLAGTAVILLTLIFIPWNPYKRLQYPAVVQPEEKDYVLGLAILNAYLKNVSGSAD